MLKHTNAYQNTYCHTFQYPLLHINSLIILAIPRYCVLLSQKYSALTKAIQVQYFRRRSLIEKWN